MCKRTKKGTGKRKRKCKHVCTQTIECTPCTPPKGVHDLPNDVMNILSFSEYIYERRKAHKRVYDKYIKSECKICTTIKSVQSVFDTSIVFD